MALPTRPLDGRCACGGGCPRCRSGLADPRPRIGPLPAGTWGEPAPPAAREVLSSPGRPLDAESRRFLEPRFGLDLGRVRVHADARAAESAREVDALAYASGRHVVFAEGRYAPGTMEGRRLLAHEIAHLAQQGGLEGSGPVRPVLQRQAVPEEERGAEYAARTCVDADDASRLERDTAVFVRRISPSLSTVYTLICDEGGRARPWMGSAAGESAIRTGPVHLAPGHTYLAAWIPASELSRQGEVIAEMVGMGSDARYEFSPSPRDARLRRVRAARWQGGSTAAPSGLDQALMWVLGATGGSSQATQAILAPEPDRRRMAIQMIQDLQEVKMREVGRGFLLGTQDEAGRLRDRLLTNSDYAAADAQGRERMITDWQMRLIRGLR